MMLSKFVYLIRGFNICLSSAVIKRGPKKLFSEKKKGIFPNFKPIVIFYSPIQIRLIQISVLLNAVQCHNKYNCKCPGMFIMIHSIIHCGVYRLFFFFLLNSAYKQSDTIMTNTLHAAPSQRVLWMVPGLSFWPWGPTLHLCGLGASSEFGHKVSSQLVPGGGQGEMLELLWHLFPFLGPLVETKWI